MNKLIASLPLAIVLAAPAVASASDGSALVQTAQSKPVQAGKRTVVGQAGITAGGRLVVRLAATNAGDGDVLAKTSRSISDEISRPADAKLKIKLRADHTGAVTVIGPKNHTEPDSAVYDLKWSATRPSIRIVDAEAAAASLRPCGTARDSQELVTRQGGSCRAGVALMRGWRNADNPHRYRGYRCGDVPGAHVEFARGGRWFASWQCTKSSTTYRIWTAL